MKLIITRHGETIENQKEIFQGHLPGTLSKKGIEEAKEVAKQLQDVHIDAIFSSDLARALDTAKEIARFHENTRLIVTENLRERYLGDLQGKKLSEMGLTKETFDWAKVKPEEGETNTQLFSRAQKALAEIIKKQPNGTVLIVGHDGINRMVMIAALGKAERDCKELAVTRNTSLTIIEITKKDSKLVLFDSMEYPVK